MAEIVTWQLKKGSEKKFRSRHPWIFSNELAESPKGVSAGGLVDLLDYRGQFLARGYGHPNSLISFRTLSTVASDAIDSGFFLNKLQEASELRRRAAVDRFSHRLVFAEGDALPGLVIDRYFLADGGQAFVVQASTAGMDQLQPKVYEAIEAFVKSEERSLGSGGKPERKPERKPEWRKTSIIAANDTKSRLMEGLDIQPKSVVHKSDDFHPESTHILIQAAHEREGETALQFHVDLLTGQKTGFFLDQRLNVQLSSSFIAPLTAGRDEIRILDLCCYVGQWGSQLAHTVKSLGKVARVTCVDASARALELAVENVTQAGGVATAQKLDVVHELNRLEPRGYDVVICDPPAFIKKKKDLANGEMAYAKMNRESIRRLAPGGLFVSCSCSGLLTDEDFRSMLARVVSGSERDLRWLAKGGHSPDHPQRVEFPQGSYLKSWIGVIN